MALHFNGIDVQNVWFNGVQLQELWFNGVQVLSSGNGLFYGGWTANSIYNHVTRINSSGALVGSETRVGTSRYALAGAAVKRSLLALNGS